ncbi:BTAD domain-containing putative transcriptional regulator [Bacillus massilinigeriensis]|uniref:BTAD domain-containing putative transcriptional regulator n=1 Tax=Bacillus massilionigeriensis TaxID=1805475 RepID=UPI00096B1FB3|nr:BTAD domain-containing putative transcriptional regulator [Bacillus massilionigeriensis]
MNRPMPVIMTKLLVPKVRVEAIRRSKLTRKMKTLSNYPLTIIHSGAGYGKSTALALYVSDEKQKCCWYSISSSDDDILPFLTYLISSIQTVIPSFGKDLLHYVKEIDRYIREDEINLLCSIFINEMTLIDDNVMVILDDYHQIEHSYTVNRWMEKLLEYIPANFHLIVSSRSRPAWKHLTKMKVQNQLLEITKNDLVLTKDEVELLLTDYYDVSVNEDDLTRIFEITEGWIIALGMIAQQIPYNNDFDDWLGHSSTTLQELFQYLALEVFMKQPPLIQQFLEQSSVIEIMDEVICDIVLGIKGSSAMLEQLVERNLFIQKIGERQYRYHALFKDFLEKQLKENHPKRYILLHERSARHFEQNLQWEEALHHYEKINQTKAVASLLSDIGGKLLESGKLENLYERLKNVPTNEKNQYYSLWLLEGEVLRYRSSYEEAEKCYDFSIAAAESNQDYLEVSKALEGKAKIYLDTIQPYRAERLLYQAIKIREDIGHKSNLEIGSLYQLLAENLINSGQAKKAEKWIERAKSLKVPLKDSNLEARLYLRTGRFEKAKNILIGSKKDQKNEASHLPQSHRETDLLLSLIESFSGNGNDAKSLAQAGIQLGMKTESPFVEACGWIRMGHAVQILNHYDLPLAIECYETALKMMDRIHVDRGKAEPLMGLCVLYGCKGEYEKAIEAGNKALQETEKVKDIWLAALITLCISISQLYNRKFLEAEQSLNKTIEMFLQCQDEYGLTLSYFWQAHLSYVMKEKEAFKEQMTLFLKHVQLGEYDSIFYKRTIFGPRDLQMFAPLLIEASKQNIFPHYVLKLQQHLNLTKLESHPGFTLRIQTLGAFRVWLGGKEVEERDWQRGKAKELLQLFVTKQGQLLSKEDIIEILWPRQDGGNASRDFKVALNALNNALEPGRKARSVPFFIIRDGSSYGINQQISIELDSTVFEEWIQTGLEEKNQEKSMAYLKRGLELYKGNYLPDRKYDDWCLHAREKLLVFFLRGAERLAQLSVRVEEYDQAIYWCERIIERDSTWEEAYRLMMFCYYRKNNRPFAIKWYRKCCKVLEQELGVDPLEPTQHMYEMIMHSQV